MLLSVFTEKMTMMIRPLLLLSCMMQLQEVAGTITLTPANYLEEIDDEVSLTCKDTEKTDIEIYFGGKLIGYCDQFAGLCPISEQYKALYKASIDKSSTEYNTMTFTIKSFAVSNCGEYTCQDKFNTSVKDTKKVEHKLSYGDSCGTCGICSPSNLISCADSKKCECHTGYHYEDNACVSNERNPVLAGAFLLLTTAAILLIISFCIIRYFRLRKRSELNISTALLEQGSKNTERSRKVRNICMEHLVWIIFLGFGALVLLMDCASGGINWYINTGNRDGARWTWYVIVTIVLFCLLIVVFIVFQIVDKICRDGFCKTEKGTSNRITDDAAHGKPVEKTVEPSTGNRNQPPLPNIVVQQGPRKDDTPLERKDALPPLDSTVAVGEDGVVQKSKKNKKKKDKTI
ncbi:uncharacterized protein LOC128234253 isoform X2 [Mya arenaria]|uniref:uncharacterized protein LOC128234253 isoform X2 n=1 Tax=Mya arenaria TaxID=6604 RepID=UPI0022E61E1C|nr:uncharacterized protein LOC128234253 isoform X2 [Mya arenaria]